MAGLNVFGVGVATADPELRTVGQKQTAVCVVNLAFNRSYQDAQKEWQSDPCFVRVQTWGNRADKMAETVKKGQPVYVSGYLKQDSWTTDKGQKRVAYSIVANDIQLCERNGKSQDQPVKTKTKAKAQVTSVSDNDGDDDNLPF